VTGNRVQKINTGAEKCRILLEIKGGDVKYHLARQPACGQRYKNKPKAPKVMAAEELTRRRAICLACEDWDARLLGCKQIHERERTSLTAYKQEHGHCARYCNGGLPKW
jgi:hypothetical protein